MGWWAGCVRGVNNVKCWNTWDVDHLNGLVYLPDGLRVRIFLVDETGLLDCFIDRTDSLIHNSQTFINLGFSDA